MMFSVPPESHQIFDEESRLGYNKGVIKIYILTGGGIK